jgi:glycosyltransferase involved in cell wall biosynthesis
MRLGIVVEDPWDFFHEIYDELCAHHEITLFKQRLVQSPFFSNRINNSIFWKDLKALLTKNDVVFFEWAGELLVKASRFPKTCGIVTRLHRYEMYQWADQVNWENVDKVILVSEAKRDEFVQRFPGHKEKAVVINVSISLERFSFQPKSFQGNIGILCHLTPRKRVYELILDFYELARQDNNFHLHIGGDPHPAYGDYLIAMQTLVKALDLENRVTFHGPVRNTPDWYHNIDIFVSNSYSEGLQVALLEAMASGCYCLSHHWSGVEEVLPSDHIYYTGHDLREKILEFVAKSEVEKNVMGQQLRDLVKNQCDIERTKIEVRQLVEAVGRQIVN